MGHCQGIIESIETNYKKLEVSDIEYNCKVEKINQLLETKEVNIDSVKLGYLYSEFSKLNFRHKDYDNAIQNVQKALDIQTKFIDSIPSTVNKSYNNLALFYLHSGNEPMALETFKTLVKQSHKDKYVINAYAIRLTDIYINRGDYYKAIDYLQEAENTIIKANDPILTRKLHLIYVNFYRVYSLTMKKDHFTKALDYLKKTEDVIAHLSPKKQLEFKIIIYAGYGYIYNRLEQYDMAISNHKKALELGLNAKKINNSDIAKSYNSLGISFTRMKKPDLAYKHYTKALQHDSLRSAVYNNLGDYYVAKQYYKEALINYQKAISYKIENFENIEFSALPSLEKLAHSDLKVNLVNNLKDKANGWYAFFSKTKNKEYLHHALKTIELADQLIDVIRSENIEQQSKYFWREKGVDLYMLATSICYELNNHKQAFYFMEKSKSLSLLENLTHEEAKNNANLPEFVKEKEYTLKHEIFKISERLKKDSNSTEIEKQSLIFEQKKVYEKFISSLEHNYPGYYNYKKRIDISSFDETRSKVVSPNTNLLQYILTENEGYGILITNESTYFFKIPEAELLNEEIRMLGRLIAKPLVTKQQLNSYTEMSFSVYQKLFPFKGASELLLDKKILIIPDYTLQYFPFETLITNRSTTEGILPYLIYFTETSYAYSASLLKKIEQKERNPKSNLIGFAPIQFKKHELSSLNRSEYKMNEIGKRFLNTTLLQEQASKSNFVTNANNYNIIHLSTHASSMSDQEPWIAFYEDILTLNELYFIKNQADLVVLDACKSGIGELQSGEGVMSLSRGFFHSGAKSVISSLWSTNEKSSTKIVLDFYAHLKKGKTKSAALRKAKLQYLKENQLSENSPHFWAPLILSGSIENSMSTAASTTTYLYIGLLLFLIVFIGLWRRYKS
ncbi:CHAT domain-containing protein [Aquimarina sp. 2304DJ70-9]|uniref:CHAT domain-containing protein n=1 Tax=Aquimarina penaris TaxID=3231044 RepID=UPI0034619F90